VRITDFARSAKLILPAARPPVNLSANKARWFVLPPSREAVTVQRVIDEGVQAADSRVAKMQQSLCTFNASFIQAARQKQCKDNATLVHFYRATPHFS
jgi:hypothetical protein